MNTENTMPSGDEIDISELLSVIETSQADATDPQKPQVAVAPHKEVKPTPAADEGQSISFTDRFESVEDYKHAMIDLIGEEAIDPDVVAEISERELLARKSHYDGPRISLRQRGFVLKQIYSKMRRPLTEAGNAQRLGDLYAGELIYCHETGTWYEWVGTHWKPCLHGEMVRHCIAMTNTILIEAQLAANSNIQKDLISHHRDSQAERSITATIKVAAQLDAFVVPLKKLDSDPSLLVCANGTVDLKTSALRKHDPEDLSTRMAHVAYDANADCPLWIQFLNTVFDGKSDVIDYVQTLVGYAATGEVREHKLVMLYGAGANGKSTFLTVLQHVLGQYAKQAPPGLLVARRGGSGHPCDVADLVGARFIVDSEVGQFEAFDAAKLKRLTGGDKIKARHLYRSFFEFWPEFTLFIAMNDKPRLPGDDEGVWRRVDLLSFEVQIPPEQRDLGFPEKLKAEASGIFRWIVEGAMKWYQHGLQTPKEVSYATEEYRAENDPIGEFLSQKCQIVSGAEVGATRLYEKYKDWCEDQGIKPVKQTTFGRSMTKRKFERAKNSRGLNVYLNIEVDNIDPNMVMNQLVAIPVSPNGKTHVPPSPKTLPDTISDDCAISQWLLNNAFYDHESTLLIDDMYNAYERDNVDINKSYRTVFKLTEALSKGGWPVAYCHTHEQLDGITLKPDEDRIASGKMFPLSSIYTVPKETPMDDLVL